MPEWSDFLTEREYRQFLTEVEEYFKSIQVPYAILEGILLVESPSFGFKKLGLVNIAQLWKQEVQDYKAQAIADHFNSIIKAREFDQEFEKRIQDFAFVRPYLGVRVYSAEYPETVGKENVVFEPLAEGIVVLLIFDQPHSITSVKPENILSWNKTPAELFRIGFTNFKSNYGFDISQLEVEDLIICFIQSVHLYAANILLDLDNHEGLRGSFGALVGVPNRHAVVVYPIETLEILKAIKTLIPIITGMYQEGPGAISSNLFWYHNREYINLPYTHKAGKLHFSPPEAFLTMLDNLEE